MTDLLLPRRARGRPKSTKATYARQNAGSTTTAEAARVIAVRGRDPQTDRLASPGRGAARPHRELTRALAQLSDAEWLQVKRDEDRRRAERRNIRSLSKRYRELRKLEEPARGSGTRRGQEESHDEQTRTT